MKNLKHTPAPWTINKYNSIVDSKGKTITVRGMALNMGSDHNEEITANQKLIASAPELLEALQNLHTAVVTKGDIESAIIKSYKAIKKATE